jgi:DNA-binding MarR family transcriptional regulator/GNAT superfamily N-acetyltransferase
MTIVDEVRGFNRFYTREIGLLAEHLPGGDFSLPEARVLYELANGGEQTAADIVRRLGMDKAQLSRILARLRGRGLVQGHTSPTHGRHVKLALSEDGRQAFAGLDQGARTHMEAVLASLDPAGRARLSSAMREICGLLGPAPTEAVRLRALVPGDMGWVAQRQALLYAREYGWDWTFEGLVCEILAAFAQKFDPARDDAWIAEWRGAPMGSVFLAHADEPGVAKLRLLFVEEAARGLGLGRLLVDTCLARARALGYRRMVLWTNDILVAARRIYQAAGFRLTEESRHHSFGHDLVGQTWELEL